MTLPSRSEPIFKDKPSIYPAPERELVLVETNSALEHQIASVRRATAAAYDNSYARIQGIVDRWIGFEHAVERRVKSIVTPEEGLTPGALYVGVATLTGSVLARNRSLLARFTLPPALFLLSMNHFLPKTSRNISAYISSLERAHTPALADAQAQISQQIVSTSSAARDAWYLSRDKTRSSVERGITLIQNKTGLKLREALGWTQSAATNPETSAKSDMDATKETK